MQVQFMLDYRSPYAYLASTQMRSMGALIKYEPIEIVSVMKRVNNQPSPMCPPKAKYAGLDAARWAKQYGVPYSPATLLLEPKIIEMTFEYLSRRAMRHGDSQGLVGIA